MSDLTTAADRADTVRVTAISVIGFCSPDFHGAQPPRGFFCAYRSCKPHWRAGRGHLRVCRSREAGLQTPLGTVSLFCSREAVLKPHFTEANMACTTTTPAQGARNLALQHRLEEIDTTLYRLQHTLQLLGDFAGQHGSRKFTDGLQLEMFAVVFGSFSDQVLEVRGALSAIQEEILS